MKRTCSDLSVNPVRRPFPLKREAQTTGRQAYGKTVRFPKGIFVRVAMTSRNSLLATGILMGEK